MPRRPPVHRGVRVGGCAGAGRGPLCRDNMRALPLAVPLPSEAGPACGGLRPQGGPGEGKHRAAPEAEATEEWRKGYAIRAGIEGTNSELKRAHGLGRLRVRGGRRVRLAVYLKALACNFKRMVHARLVEMENTAQWVVGTVPAIAAA